MVNSFLSEKETSLKTEGQINKSGHGTCLEKFKIGFESWVDPVVNLHPSTYELPVTSNGKNFKPASLFAVEILRHNLAHDCTSSGRRRVVSYPST